MLGGLPVRPRLFCDDDWELFSNNDNFWLCLRLDSSELFAAIFAEPFYPGAYDDVFPSLLLELKKEWMSE